MSIDELLNKYHNPSLIIPTESPNGNIIFHLYQDGMITHQKGGWAYKQRSEFIDHEKIKGTVPSSFFNINRLYAIMTDKHAQETRNAMIKHVKLSGSLN